MLKIPLRYCRNFLSLQWKFSIVCLTSYMFLEKKVLNARLQNKTSYNIKQKSMWSHVREGKFVFFFLFFNRSNWKYGNSGKYRNPGNRPLDWELYSESLLGFPRITSNNPNSAGDLIKILNILSEILITKYH